MILHDENLSPLRSIRMAESLLAKTYEGDCYGS
jgi:hypothetical protein